MKQFYLILLLACLTVACKSPEAREPVAYKSSSFIDESVERNKKLNKLEQDIIEKLIAENPETKYETSQHGFWYYYNTKIENDTLSTPNFGDQITFNYSISSLDLSLIHI